MIGAVQLDEPGSADGISDMASIPDQSLPILTGMTDERFRLHPSQMVANIQRGPNVKHLPNVLIDGKGHSAADTKIPENDLWLAVVACDTQMWQAGQTTFEEAKGVINQ